WLQFQGLPDLFRLCWLLMMKRLGQVSHSGYCQCTCIPDRSMCFHLMTFDCPSHGSMQFIGINVGEILCVDAIGCKQISVIRFIKRGLRIIHMVTVPAS